MWSERVRVWANGTAGKHFKQAGPFSQFGLSIFVDILFSARFEADLHLIRF